MAIEGTLPSSWGNTSAMPSLKNLTLLDLPEVSGQLPAKWGSGMSALQFLMLSNMSITGKRHFLIQLAYSS